MEVTIIPAPCRSASSVSMRPISVPLSSSRWLIGSSRKMKSNGWQRARMKATRCCCPKDNFPAFSFTFSAIPSVSKSARISFSSYIGESVLQLNVFQSRQLRENAQLLEQHAQRMFSQFYPLMNGERADIAFIKVDNTLVIVAISVDIAAQRRFTCAGSSFYQITLSFRSTRS